MSGRAESVLDEWASDTPPVSQATCRSNPEGSSAPCSKHQAWQFPWNKILTERHTDHVLGSQRSKASRAAESDEA